jgi:putative ABC transport system permease protein
MLALLRLVSVRHLLGAPLRSLLTVFGVAVGVATLVGIAAINRSVLRAFRSTVDTVAGKAELVVTGAQTGFDEAVLERVRATPGVAHASGAVSVVAAVDGRPGERLYVMGLDFLDDGFFRDLEGVDRDVGGLADDLEFLNSTDRVLLGERYAHGRGLKAGDVVRLLTPTGAQDFTVHGLLRETGPVKAFGGAVAVMFLGSAQEAFSRAGRLDRVDVATSPGQSIDGVQAALGKLLGPTYEVERPERRGASVQKMVLSFQMGLNLGSLVALLVGVFLVYNTVSIGVVQRRREIGTLRALGATRNTLRVLFTLEALLLGALGTLAGIPLGRVLAQIALRFVSESISSLYVQVNARDVQVGAVELALGMALGVGGSAVAALGPAVVASSIHPVEALRRDVAVGAGNVTWRSRSVLAGLLLLAAVYPCTYIPPPVENFPVGGYLAIFLTLMGGTLVSPLVLRGARAAFVRPVEALLGISGRIAADNFARAPVRTAVPVAALAIGVAMTVGITGFIQSFQRSSEKWIQQAVPADLFVTSSARLAGVRNTPMAPDMAETLRTLPGVTDVDMVRMLPHDAFGLRIFVISVVMDVYHRHAQPKVLAGKLPTAEQRAQGWVTISENLARRRKLSPGKIFVLPTPSGPQTLTVGAVIVDYTSDQGAVFLERGRFSAFFQDDRVDTFEVYVENESRRDEVRKAITERFGKTYDLYVLTHAELRDEALGLIDSAFKVTYAMEAVAVLLALLGVVNTLLAAVLDRTREIGLLRAVGASRGQVLTLIAAEAGLMGLTGGLLGMAMGAVLGWTVTHAVGERATGWAFPYIFPLTTGLGMLAASSLCAVLAGLLPARRAASLDVVEALAWE